MAHLSKNLHILLTGKNYEPIDLQLTTTKHFIVTGYITTENTKNPQQQALSFIIDSGANSSCLALHTVNKLHLSINNSDEEAVGLRTTEVIKGTVKLKQVKIGLHGVHHHSFAILDLSHLNTILQQMDKLHIDGIIGTDILLKQGAIIDFKHHKLYLKTTNGGK